MSQEQKSTRRDYLTSTTNGKIELAEEQLSRVGGGYKEHSQVAYLQMKIGTALITSY